MLGPSYVVVEVGLGYLIPGEPGLYHSRPVVNDYGLVGDDIIRLHVCISYTNLMVLHACILL